MTQIRIVVTEPNGVQRMMPLTPRGLTIGRGPDNNLVIGYPMTSRYHAQVIFDGANYYVTDLNSGNGTYLGNNRLIPNEPTVWLPGTPIRIGDVLIEMEQGSQPLPQPQQPQKSSRRDRQNTDTVAGWSPDAQSQDKGSRLWLVLFILLALLCVCSALGTAGYFYFVNG